MPPLAALCFLQSPALFSEIFYGKFLKPYCVLALYGDPKDDW